MSQARRTLVVAKFPRHLTEASLGSRFVLIEDAVPPSTLAASFLPRSIQGFCSPRSLQAPARA